MEPWILPVIQGYIEIQSLVLHSSNPPNVLQTLSTHREPAGVGRCEEGEGEEEGGEGDMITFSPKLDGE